jgi:hypothetical protein
MGGWRCSVGSKLRRVGKVWYGDMVAISKIEGVEWKDGKGQ